MVILSLLSWWYSQGWMEVYKSAGERLVKVSHLFSLPILIRTLGAPWRRIITYPGAGLDAKIRAFGDNLVSRAIGFTVRLLVLLTAAIILVVTAVFDIVTIVLWPLVPAGIIVCLVKGLLG